MQTCILISFAAIFVVGFHEQEKLPEDLAYGHHPGDHKRPEGSWKVNKEVDKDGNLIRYDSIYSWFSSGGSTDITPMEMDSMMRSFHSRFENNTPLGETLILSL